MSSTSGVWQRIPVLVRAVLTGLLVGFFGASVWVLLLVGSRRLIASMPSAGGPVFLVLGGLFLWGYWRYLGGRGWPRRTMETRRELLRARALPGRVWAWALSAGVLATISYVALTFVWGRLFPLQPYAATWLTGYSRLTVLCLLLGIAVEAGVVEESAFRGYMQTPLEKRYGAKIAIVIASVVFGLVHLANGGDFQEATWVVPYMFFGAILGTVAYLTNSILPSVVLHAAGDLVRFLFAWRYGPNPYKALIWKSGPDASFWLSLAVTAGVGIMAVWSYRRLAAVARLDSGSTGRSEATDCVAVGKP